MDTVIGGQFHRCEHLSVTVTVTRTYFYPREQCNRAPYLINSNLSTFLDSVSFILLLIPSFHPQISSNVFMAYPTPPSSAVVPITNNVQHPYPPTQATIQLDDLDTSTRQTSWRYGRIFPQGFFLNALFPRAMTPAQLVVEQYRQHQHQLREQEEQSARLRLELELIGRYSLQTGSSIGSYSTGNASRTIQGTPPALPPKDYPRVQSPTIEVSDNGLPDQVYSGSSELDSDSLVTQYGDTETESEVEVEYGPRIRATSTRWECLAIAVSSSGWCFQGFYSYLDQRQEATQMISAMGFAVDIPCARNGCTDTLPNLDALTTHIDMHNMGTPGIPYVSGPLAGRRRSLIPTSSSYVCLTCQACFTTLEDKIIHRRDCGLRDSSHMSPPPSPGGVYASDFLHMLLYVLIKDVPRLNRFTARFTQAFWNP